MLLAAFEQFSENEIGVKTKSDHDRKAALAQNISKYFASHEFVQIDTRKILRTTPEKNSRKEHKFVDKSRNCETIRCKERENKSDEFKRFVPSTRAQFVAF